MSQIAKFFCFVLILDGGAAVRVVAGLELFFKGLGGKKTIAIFGCQVEVSHIIKNREQNKIQRDVLVGG